MAEHGEDVETRIYTARVEDVEARELIRLDGWIDSPIWSPDGRRIAIAYSDRMVRGSSLWLVDLSEALEVGGI